MKNKIIIFFISLSLVISSFSTVTAHAAVSSNRLFGQDRYETSSNIAQYYNSNTVNNVILVYGEDFPDALSASVLAHKLDAPILLVDPASDGSSNAFDYIGKHLDKSGNVYIIGSAASANDNFKSYLNQMGYKNIIEIGNNDRYYTNYMVAQELDVPQNTPVVISSGENYPDALGISSFAAHNNWPILLVPNDIIPDKTSQFLLSDKPSKVYITGGTGVISSKVEEQIRGLLPDAKIIRFAGQDRFDTNAQIIQAFASEPKAIYLASGYGFADALSGSVLAARTGDPIVLIDPAADTVPAAVAPLLLNFQAAFQNVISFGGTAVVPESIAANAKKIALDKDTADKDTADKDTVDKDTAGNDTVDNVTSVDVKGVRVVVDGKVNTFDAKLSGGDWYLKPADIKAALGVDAKATLGGYASLRDAARTANVNYEHDGVLNAAYIWTDEPYLGDSSSDFNSAISTGLVPDNLKTGTERQITANEFRALLSAMVGKLEPGKVTQFEKNVTTYNKPLLRGEGFVMAYYAAVCVGADTWNNNFDPNKTGDDFWDDSVYELDKLFPHIWEGPVKFYNNSNEWRDYHTAAFLWSFWHSSPYSGHQVFDYDEVKGSMRQKEPLTVKEAVSAAARIYDSYALTQYVSLTDKKAVNYDKTIITDKLLSKSKALPAVTKENMPVWKGFTLSHGGSYENTDIVETAQDLRNIANWGFNSVRFMLTYRTLFDENVQSVNVNNLKKLDALIAAAIKYNLHIDLLTFSLPGRWTRIDPSTFKTTGSFDLFTNPDRQKEANAVWALLSERYKDVPSSTLSFCPIWEAQNHNLSSGLYAPPYTSGDVAKVYCQLIDTIKKHSPDRFIIYEPTPNNNSGDIIKESGIIKDTIESKYPDALMMSNFCEMPFVYADMTAAEGANIDHQNHSMFKTAYPTMIYAAQYHIQNGSTLDMDGELVAGTKINIYLSKIDGVGNFEIKADGKTLYSESLSTRNFNTKAPLSGYYPYAKSDKLISVTLQSDVKKLQIGYGGNWFEWSGIDIILPARYTVKRWWVTSEYDAMLSGGVEKAGLTLKDTSTVMFSPNSYNGGRTITINPDVTYTTPEILAQSNKQTIEDWAKAMSKYSPDLIVRFESAAFNGGIHDSALNYYDDLLSVFAKYGISWFSNDYWCMTHADYFYAGVKPVQYKDFPSFDADMLKLLQKHQ